MRLLELRIRNYRCYKDEIVIKFDDLTAIVGRNDSGKSTILEALDIFLGESVPDKDDACKHGNPKDLSITAIFSDLPATLVLDQDAQTSLADEHLLNSDGNLEIRKVFNGSLEKPRLTTVELMAIHPSAEKVVNLSSLSNVELKTLAMDIGADTSQIDKKINAELRRVIRAAVPDLKLIKKTVPLIEGNGANFWKGVHLPAFFYFKADRASTDQDPEAQDPLNAAIKDALKKREAELNAIQTFVEQEIKKVADLTLETLNEMDSNLAQSLRPECSIKPWSSLFKVSITGDSQIPINKRGSGVRRMILLNFLRAKAELLRRENHTQSMIYAIEEPETSQHPRSQRLLISVLQEMSCTQQVIITTHTPMLARVVSDQSIRFVKANADLTREIVVGGNDATNRLIAESLGVLPDHTVRLFIGVEGNTDIPFLRNVSKILIASGENVLDLEELEINGEIVFILCGGSSLVHWSNRLKPLNRPEFHVYDRDALPPAPPKCQDAVDRINARADCKAVITQKREIENYIHHDAINLAFRAHGIPCNVAAPFADFDDVPETIITTVNANVPGHNKWGKTRAKEFLSLNASHHMTRNMLDHVDPNTEILNWFRDMRVMFETAVR